MKAIAIIQGANDRAWLLGNMTEPRLSGGANGLGEGGDRPGAKGTPEVVMDFLAMKFVKQ